MRTEGSGFSFVSSDGSGDSAEGKYAGVRVITEDCDYGFPRADRWQRSGGALVVFEGTEQVGEFESWQGVYFDDAEEDGRSS